MFGNRTKSNATSVIEAVETAYAERVDALRDALADRLPEVRDGLVDVRDSVVEHLPSALSDRLPAPAKRRSKVTTLLVVGGVVAVAGLLYSKFATPPAEPPVPPTAPQPAPVG